MNTNRVILFDLRGSQRLHDGTVPEALGWPDIIEWRGMFFYRNHFNFVNGSDEGLIESATYKQSTPVRAD